MPTNEKPESARRLEQALGAMSVRKFQKRMAARSAPSSSYANIHRFVKRGKGNPPPQFFIAAAEVLNVPLNYLLGRSNTMDTDEEALEQAAMRETREQFLRDFEAALTKGFGRYPEVSSRARGPIWEAWNGLRHRARVVRGAEAKIDGFKVAQDLGRAIRAPLKALGIEMEEVQRRALTRYVVGVCQALTFLTSEYDHKVPPD